MLPRYMSKSIWLLIVFLMHGRESKLPFHFRLYISCLTIKIIQVVIIALLILPSKMDSLSKYTIELVPVLSQFSTASQMLFASGQSYSRWEMVSGVLHESQFSLSLIPNICIFFISY